MARSRLPLLGLLLLGGLCCVRKPPVAVEPATLAEEKPKSTQATRLLPDPAATAPQDVAHTLARVDELLGSLARRSLTQAQFEERKTGATFVSQARSALEAGEPERAAILAEKALVLMQSLEEETRP